MSFEPKPLPFVCVERLLQLVVALIAPMVVQLQGVLVLPQLLRVVAGFVVGLVSAAEGAPVGILAQDGIAQLVVVVASVALSAFHCTQLVAFVVVVDAQWWWFVVVVALAAAPAQPFDRHHPLTD
jgi:hypothetical protein